MLYSFGQIAFDARLLNNLIAIHLGVLFMLALSIGLRWLVTHWGNRLACWTCNERVKNVSAEATRHCQTTLFWLTVTAMTLIVGIGLAYHALGRDARVDWVEWSSQVTAADLARLGITLASLAVLAVLTSGLVRAMRRCLPALENHALAKLSHPQTEPMLRRWFQLFDIFAVLCVRLSAVVAAFSFLGFSSWAFFGVSFVLYVVGIIAVARLATLAFRAATLVLADYGTKHLGQKPFCNYWERIARLMPFAGCCFEAAVFVYATSLIVGAFHIFLNLDASKFGPKIVGCIGLFFCTRVVIELLQVLLNDAFGLYKEENEVDQKGRTLVPLLHSMCQYVLYFGSSLLMLGVLGLDTTPILAAASILGLAVGLGAQSLVTDVVSGFFILFENQFLVGDYVKVGEASGTVEEVGMRVTRIRDGNGKLHIIPNGQIKGVVSYSKGYVNAVVDVKMPSGSDLEGLFRAMKEAGKRLRSGHKEVVADTEVHGLVEWNTSDMTIRAVTKVRPGTHGVMQNEYRRMLKQVFDEKHAPAKLAA